MTAGELTPELVMELLRPGEVALSPDGSRIAFSVSASFREQGKPIETRLWVGDVDGEPAPGESGSHPRFSPDGSRLACASDRGHEGRQSLWVDDRELGEIPGSVEEIHWAPDGSRLLVLAADLGADRAGADSATKIQEAGAEAQDPKVFRPGKFWRRIWLVDADTGETRDVSPEGVNVFEIGWSGSKAAAVCTDDPSESAWYDAWIGLIDLDKRTFDRVYTPKWQLQSPRISPGGQVAFIEGFSSDRGTLTGTVHVLGMGPIAPELDTTWIEFADEDTLWVAGYRGAGTFAGQLSLGGSGSYLELFGGDATIGPRYAPSFTARVTLYDPPPPYTCDAEKVQEPASVPGRSCTPEVWVPSPQSTVTRVPLIRPGSMKLPETMKVELGFTGPLPFDASRAKLLITGMTFATLTVAV